MRAIVYVRVSTDAQERDGTSLDTQERACLDYAKAAGWTVVDLVRDAASGFSLERPGIETIRAAMRSKTCDVVLAYAVDRLSRHQNHIGVLFDEADGWGVQFEFVTERFEDTAMGRFILAARAFMAEVEREKIAERTMRGKAERARAGKLPQSTGKGLYGYIYNRDTGQREVEATQAAVVRRIYEHYAATRSFSAVANELNDAGVPAFSGGRWHPLTIRNVLTKRVLHGPDRVPPHTARKDAVRPNTETDDARRRTPRVRLDRGRRRHPADRPARPLAAGEISDELMDEIEKRFDLVPEGQLRRTKQGWPLAWEATRPTEERTEFIRSIARFSSNYAPLFGRLLTPLVSGVRVAGPFVPSWSKNSPKLVILDGEGLGHTPKSSSAVPTAVSRRIEEADAVVLVDNAEQPLQAAPVAAMREVISTGNARKLILAFTHFDRIEGDNLPNDSAKARHVLASAENVLAAIGEDLGPFAERALRNRIETARFFLGRLHGHFDWRGGRMRGRSSSSTIC